jgi:O-antigen/teichoic acid export membrane protein
VLSLAALTETLTQTPYAAFEGYGDLKPVAVGLGLERFLAAGLGITAMALGVGLVVVGVCYLAAALSAFVYVNQAVARRIARPQLTISRATLRRLLIASAPIALSFAFAPILSRGGTAILSAYKGNDAVGLYAAGYRLFEGTFFIGWALVGALVPMLSRAGRTTQPPIDRLFELGLKVLTFSLLPVTVGMLLFARTIVTTLFGEGFADAASATQWLAAAVWLYGIARLASATLVAQDRAGLLPWVTGGSALTSVVAGLLLIPGHSFNGAAAASTGGWAVEAVLAVGAVLRFAPRVSFPRMVLASVVGCAAMVVAAVLLGRGLYGLVIAAVAYVAVAGLLERRLFPRDFELITSSLARRGPVESSADAPLLL